ncbi:hypothetical protein RND71_014790 [Anisodus tanguticus]|uniref:Uncharacterized protein n=1 Tax=Anisodus tanguticus TaxID=243964 RepID=A0AAE1VP01_9SOLA|nr:hypothetical protein RND71_014790 [Anisodus tanguticus]
MVQACLNLMALDETLWSKHSDIIWLQLISSCLSVLATASSSEGLPETAALRTKVEMWVIESGENEKKTPSVSYQASLSYHIGAVNALRLLNSPSRAEVQDFDSGL